MASTIFVQQFVFMFLMNLIKVLHTAVRHIVEYLSDWSLSQSHSLRLQLGLLGGYSSSLGFICQYIGI